MSYCSHITSEQVYKMVEFELNHILDNCELNCDRYSQCDTVALMNDKLKELHNES